MDRKAPTVVIILSSPVQWKKQQHLVDKILNDSLVVQFFHMWPNTFLNCPWPWSCGESLLLVLQASPKTIGANLFRRPRPCSLLTASPTPTATARSSHQTYTFKKEHSFSIITSGLGIPLNKIALIIDIYSIRLAPNVKSSDTLQLCLLVHALVESHPQQEVSLLTPFLPLQQTLPSPCFSMATSQSFFPLITFLFTSDP